MPSPAKKLKDNSLSPIDRLLASISELRKHQTSKSAHLYRTGLRRFLAWNAVVQPKLDEEKKQALKSLNKLRKITGKLRDSEVHLDLIEQLDTKAANEKKKVEKVLRSRRKSAKKKLVTLISDGDWKRYSRALRLLGEPPLAKQESGDHLLSGANQLALDEYRAFVRSRAPLSPENLHSYRLACKSFRYTAELAGETPQVRSLVDTWKKVQDVSGDWHDYLVLSELTEEVCGDCTLHSLLIGLRDKKYDESVLAVEEAERRLLGPELDVPKKEPRSAPVQRRRAG